MLWDEWQRYHTQPCHSGVQVWAFKHSSHSTNLHMHSDQSVVVQDT